MNTNRQTATFYNPKIGFSTHLRLNELQKRCVNFDAENAKDTALNVVKRRFVEVARQKQAFDAGYQKLTTTDEFTPLIDAEDAQKIVSKMREQEVNSKVKEHLSTLNLENVFENTVTAEVRKANLERQKFQNRSIQQLGKELQIMKEQAQKDRFSASQIQTKEVIQDPIALQCFSKLILSLLKNNENELIESLVDDILEAEVRNMNALEEITQKVHQIAITRQQFVGEQDTYGLAFEICKKLEM